MESSQAGPSTSLTNSAIGINNTGPGNVTAENVTVHNYNSASASAVYDFPLPRLIETFRGREAEMRELDEAFFTQQKNKVVICGLGGFGKSELSKQFGHQCRVSGKVHSVVWMESEDPNKLKESFKKLNIIYEQCADKQLIIIFDNSVTQKSIAEYEPRGNQNHRVLITSQSADWRSDVPIMKLKPLSSDHALQVFKSVLGDKFRVEDEHLYETLAYSVSYIPLGLQIVASFVEQGDEDFNLTDYVTDIKKSEENLIKKIIPDCADNSYDKTIYGAMVTSIHKIKNKPDQEPQVRELAHDVLCFTAYLRPEFIKTEYLLDLVKMKNNECKYNEYKLALKLVLKFSFLRYGNNNKSYLVQHRTTQACVRYYISESKLQSVYYKVCLDLELKRAEFFISSRILNYADSNVTIVHGFYKDNYMHENISLFLEELVRRKCIQCIKTIFENPDEQTKNYINTYDLLAECASTENVEILKVLLSHVDINSKNDEQDTALHVLAKWEDLKGIKLLVRHGADVNVPNAAGDSVLFTFIRENYLDKPSDWDEVFKTFQRKVDYSVTNSKNQTLLHAAATGKQLKLIDFFIENGLQLNQTDNNGWTPLDSLYNWIPELFYTHYRFDPYVPMLEKLLRLGATSNIKHRTVWGDSRGFLLLNYALKRNNLELLELLLNSGVDVNSRNCIQQTILHTCVFQNNLEATQIVIAHNADCYVRDENGYTPLFYFTQYRRNKHINIEFLDNTMLLDFLECKLDSNDDDNIDMDFVKNMLDLLQCHDGHVDAAGNTVLHRAVKHFKLNKLVEMLIKHYKFDVNVQNFDGNTPLHVLISSLNDNYYDLNHLKNIITMIETLKNNNARLDQNNKLNKTPLDMLQRICTASGDNTIINYLRPYLTPAPSSVNNRKRKLDS